MFRRPLLAVIGALAFAGGAAAQDVSTAPEDAPAGAYHIDKGNASVILKVSHMGISFYTLRMDGVDASLTYDPANPAAAKVTATIAAASVDTGDPAMNAKIAGEVFEAKKYPQITFVSTAVRPGPGGKGAVVGALTFHGVTRPVTLDVVFNGVVSGPDKVPHMGFSAVGQISRSEFGLTTLSGVGDDVGLIIEAEFVR